MLVQFAPDRTLAYRGGAHALFTSPPLPQHPTLHGLEVLQVVVWRETSW